MKNAVYRFLSHLLIFYSLLHIFLKMRQPKHINQRLFAPGIIQLEQIFEKFKCQLQTFYFFGDFLISRESRYN
nr:MAG TPA: hypothetical protein [Caudoviricetes sp.]